MQIHELNKKSKQISEQQVNEVDLVGPNSIWNVGKEVIKNPSALLTNRRMGAAKQAAYQSSAADSAAALAKQGFTAGASTKQQSSQQTLATVKANPGIQRVIKGLAAQWKSISPGIVTGLNARSQTTQQPAAASTNAPGYSKVTTNAPVAAVPAVAEALVAASPNSTRDPVVKQTLSGLYSKGQQPAAPSSVKYNVPASVIKTPSQQVAQTTQNQKTTTRQVDTNIVGFSTEFKKWANTKLLNLKISLDEVERDPWAKAQLEQLLLKIATLSLADPSAQATNDAVEDFFNVAYAANIAAHQNDQAVSGRGRAAPGGATSQQNDKEIIQQSGVPLNQTQIQSLGDAIRKDLDGNRVIRDTGSALLNAIARTAGLQIGR